MMTAQSGPGDVTQYCGNIMIFDLLKMLNRPGKTTDWIPIPIEAGEEIHFADDFQASQDSRPFGIAFSNRGIYTIKSKKFTISNPYYYARTNRADITSINIVRRPTLGLYILSIIMILTGGLFFWSLKEGTEVTPRAWGYGAGTAIVGILLPFIIPGKFLLIIQTKDGEIKWVPPLTVDRQSKERISRLFAGVAEAGTELGYRILDERNC